MAFFSREAESEDSWQQRLISMQLATGRSIDGTEEVIELFDRLDNLSHQCSGYHDSVMPCIEDRPLWWRVLQWLKMILLKMASSYHGKPMLLVIMPLLIGLSLGYFWGNQSQNQRNGRRTRLKNWLSLLVFYVGEHFSDKTYLDRSRGKRKHPKAESHPKLGSDSKISKIHSSVCQSSIASETRENLVRTNLTSDAGSRSESGVDKTQVPSHVAVIMDGNRRYGKQKYGNASQGHWDGSSKLVEFAKWCIAEHISVLTVYAFSTENWNRDPSEVRSLMAIFAKYVDELRIEAMKRNIKVLILSTDSARIPPHVQHGLRRLVEETEHCNGLTMNICMSYGSRGEIVAAARSLATDVASGIIDVDGIDEDTFESRLLTSHSGDPDVLIRTSGEVRISNFLLWQLAYTEMFFLDKPWPAVEKEDLLKIIRTYASGRIRRFGK